MMSSSEDEHLSDHRTRSNVRDKATARQLEEAVNRIFTDVIEDRQ